MRDRFNCYLKIPNSNGNNLAKFILRQFKLFFMVKKLKHLELLQNVIARMNSNSFLLKGWAVTIVSALFALSKKDTDSRLLIVAFISIVTFWILDSYFLSQERQYRELYDEVVKIEENLIDFSMNAKGYDKGKNKWICSLFSTTLMIFYMFLILIVLIVKFLIN